MSKADTKADTKGTVKIEGDRKSCIFYLPYPLEKTGNRARQLRPRKMLMAFREMGYRVFLIQGYSEKRKARIKLLKSLIGQGVKFDFMYGETSTEPIRLSDPKHLPVHPFMDFAFFRYLKEQGIPVGIFYCDIYWKFPVYKESVSGWRYYAAIHFYRSEMKKFSEALTRLFIPDLRMCRYMECPEAEAIASALPPGADPVTGPEKVQRGRRSFNKHPLEIFYVGGIGAFYRLDELLKAIEPLEQVRLTICCRENEWETEKEKLLPLMTDRVEVVHKNEDELAPYYEKADIGSLMFEADEYRGMARPVKAYEYLGHHLPVLATKGTAIGDFAEETGFGWSLPFDSEAIRKKLEEILAEPKLLTEKRKLAKALAPENLWISRAKQAAEELTGKQIQ